MGFRTIALTTAPTLTASNMSRFPPVAAHEAVVAASMNDNTEGGHRMRDSRSWRALER